MQVCAVIRLGRAAGREALAWSATHQAILYRQHSLPHSRLKARVGRSERRDDALKEPRAHTHPAGAMAVLAHEGSCAGGHGQPALPCTDCMYVGTLREPLKNQA